MTFFNNRLFVIGGRQDADTYLNGVWTSQTNMFKAK